MEASRRVLGDDHPETLSSINNMGALLQTQGKLTEAEPYYREALDGRRRVLGDDHPDTLNSINSLGYLLFLQDKDAEAEPHFREALEGYQKVLPPRHWYIGITQSGLGECLTNLGRFAQAEPLLLSADEILCHGQGAPPDRLLTNSARLIDLYDAWHAAVPEQGHDAKAAEWREKLEEASPPEQASDSADDDKVVAEPSTTQPAKPDGK